MLLNSGLRPAPPHFPKQQQNHQQKVRHRQQQQHQQRPLQFRSSSPPAPPRAAFGTSLDCFHKNNLHEHSCHLSTAAFPSYSFSKMPAPSTRPHAFTMSGPLEGLQRDWLMNGCQQDRGHRSRLQQQQHQMLYFQPKPAAKITMFREPTTFCCPVSAAQQPRRRCRPQKHSPPPSIGRQQQQEKLLAKSLLGFPPPSDCGHTFGQFMRLFDEGQLLVRLPVAAAQKHAQVLGGRRKLLDWVVNPAELGEVERRQLVQRFAMGLPAEKQPYSLIASHGLKDLLFSSATGAADLAECLPAVMPHLRLALNSGNLWKKLETLELLREMAQLEGIGHRLVPYFRMLLPSLRIGLASSRIANSSADVLDRHQQQERLVNAIDRTLLTLEQMGGPRASESIKHFSNRLL